MSQLYATFYFMLICQIFMNECPKMYIQTINMILLFIVIEDHL